MANVRIFIAVDLSAEVKAQIAGLIAGLSPLSPAVRWVRPEGLHLTLKFLGEIPEARLPEIFASLEKALAGRPSFRFRLAGTGGFPSLRRPRVLWIGLREGREPLQELSGLVEKALVPCGFPPEKRPFSPHLTIGRVKSPHGIQAVLERLPGNDFTSAPIAAEAVKVMKSRLKPTGAEYSALKIIDLNSPAQAQAGDRINPESGEPSADPTP